MRVKKPWFNYWSGDFHQEDESFTDTSGFLWHREMENKADSIVSECKELVKIKGGNFQPYFLKEMDGNNNSWSTITIKTWGVDVKKNIHHCPVINKFLQDFPEILSFAISKLSGNSQIHEHRGDTDAIWRCHMGIKVPGSLPDCGFEVNGEKRSWIEKKIFSFSDAHIHKAWNNTNEERWIIIFDVVRPQYFSIKNRICIRVRAFMIFQGLMQKYSAIKNAQKVVHWKLYILLQGILWLLQPWQRKNGVILKHE